MAAHKLQGRVKLYGFEISIENAKGSVRRWHDPHSGESGSTKMQHDYGYIRGTRGTDGDHVDVYVGPSTDSQKVFVIDQMKKPDFKKFDEQKCMLGFDSAEEAKAAYLKHYNDSRFFGSMREMSMDDFRAKVLARENHGKKIAEARLLVELNLAKIAAGEPIVMPKKEVLGSDAGVDSLPPVTAYSEATMSKDEREAADREVKTAGLSHSHESTRGLRRSAVAEGRQVEAEHTKDRGTATQIAIDHLHEDPQYYTKLRKVEKTAVSHEWVRRTIGGAKAPKGRLMEAMKRHSTKAVEHGENAVHSLKDKGFQPRMEHYRRHVAKADKRQVAADAAWDAVEKKSSGDRAGRIADRIDDVGIGLLAAPYAADAGSRLMMRVGGRNAKVRAAATALKAGFGSKSHFGHSAPRELAGLAMVAPGVTHTIAKGIDKAVPQKTASGDMLQYFQDHPEKLEEKRKREKKAALEKVAQSLFDDYEYKTEAEKTAILGMLGRAAGAVARGGAATRSAIGNAGQAVAQGAGKMTSGLMGAVERAGTQLKGGYLAGRTGVSQARGEFAARAGAAAKAPAAVVPKVPAVTPPAAVAKGGVPTPVPTTTAAPAAAAGGSGKWNPLSARNVLLGGAAAGVGLGAYGGYKGIQTASHMLQNHHETPLAPPGFAGTGRVF